MSWYHFRKLAICHRSHGMWLTHKYIDCICFHLAGGSDMYDNIIYTETG